MKIHARRSVVAASLAFVAGAAWVGCGGSGFVSIDDTDGGIEGGPGQDGATSDSNGATDTGGGHDSATDARPSDAPPPTDGGADGNPRDSGGAESGMDSGSDTGAPDARADAGCPAPLAGSIYVAPSGSDATGNGSQTCPFVTITKALSTTLTASGATTIFVQSGTAGTPNVYGNGCTAGGSSCDVTPIHVTDGMNKGIIIEGTSADPTALRVVSGMTAADNEVFLVNPPNVGFQNLTVVPKRLAAGNPQRVEGTIGIAFFAPAVSAGQEAVVTNVIIEGAPKTASSESTGSGIAISNGTSPTIGPGVTIFGGDHSVLVTQVASGAVVEASKPVITSSAAAPSFFHSSQFACVRVESANAGAGMFPSATVSASTANDPGRLHLQDCGGNGGVVVDTVSPGPTVDVSNTLVDVSGNGVGNYGIRVQHSGSLHAGGAVTITGITQSAANVGAGIEATDNAAILLSAGVAVTTNGANGVHVGGRANAGIDGLVSSGNFNGLLCDAMGSLVVATANVTLRNSTFLQNKATGVLISSPPGGTPCSADLGGNSVGNNTYNHTSKKNAGVGLCYMPLVPATASSSTWGCGLGAAAACTPAATPSAPTPIIVSACDQAGDYNQNASLTVALPQTCCGL